MNGVTLIARLLLFIAASGFAAESNHDIWVVSGQSNAIGRGALPGRSYRTKQRK